MICKYCGKEFIPKQSRSVYCSRECQIKGFHQSRQTQVTKVCAWCGMEYVTEHRGTKYCSPSCRKNALKKQQDILNMMRPKVHYDPKACLHCGKEFIPREKRQIYCSKECSAIHNRKKYHALAEERKKAKEERKALLPQEKPKKKTYKYKKNEGIETPQPKPIENLSPASKRWAKMSWTELTQELLYYKLRYTDAQLMAKNNTLPEDFGLKRKKGKECCGK